MGSKRIEVGGGENETRIELSSRCLSSAMKLYSTILMNQLEEKIILIKGAGEKASAVAYLLYESGFRKIVMTDLAIPLAERRGVSFCEAIIDWRKEVCGVIAQRADFSIETIGRTWSEGKIAVLADPETRILNILRPNTLIDAIMAKKNTGTKISDAALVIALGPGFVAGKDTHVVIETNPRSSNLGGVISEGYAEQDTGIPAMVHGLDVDRILISPAYGTLRTRKDIGDKVAKGDVIAHVNGYPLAAPISGVIWGLVRDGVRVKKGQKIGDIDPQGKKRLCFEITDHSRTIAEGVLEALRLWINQTSRKNTSQ